MIPTLNAALRLGACLDALVQPVIDGVVKEVIIVDGGSSDDTLTIVDGFGAKFLTAPPGRGGQLRAGAAAASGDWQLFLHADTVLQNEWAAEARIFIEKNPHHAGVFTLAFEAPGLAPRIVSAGAMLRTKLFKSPYGDQGLLISKTVYEEIGGYRDMPLFEDVDIVQRLLQIKGANALHILAAKAATSAERYEREGYLRRVLKNALLLARFHLGASPEKLREAYR